MSNFEFTVHNAEQTARLLDFRMMVDELRQACTALASGRISAPERQVVEFPNGGLMLSMPAAADDMAIHKLVNVMPQNSARGLPTIQGVVIAYDGQTGRPLFSLDGPTVTERRTAAVSMLGLETLLTAPPRHVCLIGYGVQAHGHVQALIKLYPDARITVTGRDTGKAERLAEEFQRLGHVVEAAGAIPADCDVVITATSSLDPVYNEAATAQRLIIGVGAFRPDMAEIGATTMQSSQLYVDEPAGARHEAGDYIRAGVNWENVHSIADVIEGTVQPQAPMVYKTVGGAAWDLAAARAARKQLA